MKCAQRAIDAPCIHAAAGTQATIETGTAVKYPKTYDGEWVRPVMSAYRMMCCDCKLVHVLDFRIIRWGRGFKVLFKVRRDNRATAAARRHQRNDTQRNGETTMPEKQIKARGGAVRYRTIKRAGKTLRCAVVKRKGPKGGKTVCWRPGHD